jgi:hypothetical protein
VKSELDDQSVVAAVLASRPRPDVPADFLSRVNARIDETAGWFGLVDFRLWTLRLAPAAAALALIAVLWPTTASSSSASSPVSAEPSATFSPASATDWQQDVSADALLDAALQPAAGGARVR